MKLAHLLLLSSATILAACSGSDIGEGVLGGDDDGGGGSRGDGGASSEANTGGGASGPGGTGSATGSGASGATSGPGATSSAAAGPGATSSAATSGPGATSSASSGTPAVCGDLVCNGAETCATCPNDCLECSDDCGNGICDPGEAASCPQDCNPQSVASSSSGMGGQCPPDPCEAGGTADATCFDPCVVVVCSQDALCCEGAWDQVCADTAVLLAGFGFCTC